MMIQPDEIIPNEQAAKELNLQPNTLTAWRHRRIGPPYVKIGRQIYYRRHDLAEWLGAQRHEPQARAS